MLKGWYKQSRILIENPICTKSTAHMAVWIYLCCYATNKKYKTVFNGKEISLNPGQLITGREKIANRFKDLNESKVQRILKDFENAQQIEQQTTSHGRLITLKNWGKYQSVEHQIEQQVNNNRTTTEQQVNTIREYKNKENIENEREGTSPNTPTHSTPYQLFGEFKNVRLTDWELNSLKEKYPNQYQQKIERLSSYIATSGKEYKNHYAVLLQWLAEDLAKGEQCGGKFKGNEESKKGKWYLEQKPSYDIDELENKVFLDDIEL